MPLHDAETTLRNAVHVQGADQQAETASGSLSWPGTGDPVAFDGDSFSAIEEEVLLQTEAEQEPAAASGEAGATGAEGPGAVLGERLAALEATCSAISQEDMEAQGGRGRGACGVGVVLVRRLGLGCEHGRTRTQVWA